MVEQTSKSRPRSIRFKGEDRPIFYLKSNGHFDVPKNLRGIYVFVCLKSGSAYIGSSKDIAKRARTHIRHLQQGKHINYKLGERFEKNSDQ